VDLSRSNGTRGSGKKVKPAPLAKSGAVEAGVALRRARAWWWLAVLLTAASGRAVPDDAPVWEVGFEAGWQGVWPRLPSGADRAELERDEPAHGRWLARLTRGAEGAGPALEAPWARLEPGAEYTLSAYLRAREAGVVASLAVTPRGLGGATEESFPLAREWRRYALTFRCGPEPWVWPALRLARGGPATVQVDGWQLARGDRAEHVARAAVGLVGGSARGLRQAGESLSCGVRLHVPGRDEAVPLGWQLETVTGLTVRAGGTAVELSDQHGEAKLPLGRFGPGAYRLVARARLTDAVLTAERTFLVSEPRLVGPTDWFATGGATPPADVALLPLLDIGWLRGVAGPGGAADLAGPAQRAGLVYSGYLPVFGESAADALRLAEAARGWRAVAAWELPPGVLSSADPMHLAGLRAARDGLRAAGSRARLAGVRLDAGSDPLAMLDRLAAVGALALTDAVVLHLRAREPEPVDGANLAELVARLRTALAVHGTRVPLWVSTDGPCATAWRRARVAPPTGAVDAETQAGLLARAILLARAGGAERFLYGGTAVGRLPSHCGPAASGLSADLVDEYGELLPAAGAVAWAMRCLRDRGLAESLPLAAGVTCLHWGGRRPLGVVWRHGPASGRVRLRLPLDGGRVGVTDCTGAPALAQTGRQVVLELGAQPWYLHGRDGVGLAAALRAARVEGVAPQE
jgi:hypothetical protein